MRPDRRIFRRRSLLPGLLLCLALYLPARLSARSSDTVTLLFLGDLMMHRAQLESARIPGRDTLQSASYRFDGYFTHLRGLTDSADFVVANLECTLEALPYSGYPAFSAPRSFAEEARRSGIDLFLLANNHICDKGRRGLAATADALDSIRALRTGCFRDSLDEARNNPFLHTVGGHRIAFINFTYGTNGIPVPPPWIVPGTDTAQVRRSVRRAREAEADLIIALPHWGDEYRTEPSGTQRFWQEYLYRLGVDAIVGTHPHVVQPVERDTSGDGRLRRVTFFSLGNAVSNMSARNTRTGLMAELRIVRDADGKSRIAAARGIWTWCSRAGRYGEGYTVLPIAAMEGRRGEFRNPADYDLMMNEYKRLKSIVESWKDGN